VRRKARRHFIEHGWLEAVIGLPAGLFYGTGIPACVPVMNKKDAGSGDNVRDHVYFINADREYREVKAQSFLRPEDISKIVHAYRTMADIPGYARRVPVSEIKAEDFNCNIRRYVDNAPPPEPHDVRAHLHGGVPIVEIESLARYWTNYPGLRERCFVLSDQSVGSDGSVICEAKYADFTAAVTDRRALAELVKTDPGVAAAQSRFQQTLEKWWTDNLSLFEELAPKNEKKGNVYELRRQLLITISDTFALPSPSGRGAGGEGLLTDHQIRGAFARYVDDLKADLKSIAASGWGAELIPDADILESQFPEILADMEQKRLRLAELSALYTAADEKDYEDSDDTGVLPADEVKALKAELKESNAQAKLAKKENRDAKSYAARAKEAEARLARHKELEDEGKQLKAELRATEKKQEELVAAAREKITPEEAKAVILDRLHRVLVQTYEGYLRADQRACLAVLENLNGKYAITAKDIEDRRNKATEKLKGFLVELGYE
jgi:type I restriction enzyme M protein